MDSSIFAAKRNSDVLVLGGESIFLVVLWLKKTVQCTPVEKKWCWYGRLETEEADHEFPLKSSMNVYITNWKDPPYCHGKNHEIFLAIFNSYFDITRGQICWSHIALRDSYAVTRYVMGPRLSAPRNPGLCRSGRGDWRSWPSLAVGAGAGRAVACELLRLTI